MANLKRFQWIPMIVKAYNQARQQTQMPRDGVSPMRDAIVPTPDLGKPAVQRQDLSTADPKKPRRHKRARSRRMPVQRSHRGQVRRVSPSDVPSGRGIPYARFIRELQDTKSKLSQLQTIESQLNQMQSRIETRFSELLARVEGQERQTARIPEELDPLAGPLFMPEGSPPPNGRPHSGLDRDEQ